MCASLRLPFDFLQEISLRFREGDQIEPGSNFCPDFFFSPEVDLGIFYILMRPKMLVRFRESRCLWSWGIWEEGWALYLAPFVFQTCNLSGFFPSSVLWPPQQTCFSSDYISGTCSSTKGYRRTVIVIPPPPNWQGFLQRHPEPSLSHSHTRAWLLLSRTHLAAEAIYSALSNLYCSLALLTFPINLIYP